MEVLEARDEGKLLSSNLLGRVRLVTFFKKLVARSFDSIAASPTVRPLTLAPAQSSGVSPLGVVNIVIIYADLVASLNT